MAGKIVLFSLKLVCLFNIIMASTLKLPYVEDIQDMIIDEIFADSLILPGTIKEERGVLSQSRELVLTPEKDVTFHLFTRSNPEDGYVLKVGDSMNLKGSPVRRDQVVKIIIHGWTDKGTTNWLKNFRKNYLFVGDFNVVVVNWFPMSMKEYSVATKLTEQIGAYVAELITFLTTETNISLSNIHILGHSLGAHIAGFAGSNLSGNIGRITGMDPARPGFESPIYKDETSRLDPSDALFVDVIHTCAGTVGFVRAIGHVDFYPNGGTFRQPGCAAIVSQYCSHGRSYQFMAESIISPRGFIAQKCDSWVEYRAGKCRENSTAIMGEEVSKETRGNYFLETNGEPPYGKGNPDSAV